MAHWSDQYLGLPYVEFEMDCAALAAKVQKEVFGHEIKLPQSRPAGIRDQSNLIADLQADYATPTDNPEDGDGVLMVCRGISGHIGIYCKINGVPWVLHAMKNAGMVCRHKVRDLGKYNLRVDGVYKWI